jgi:pyruvyl transferase EpsO
MTQAPVDRVQWRMAIEAWIPRESAVAIIDAPMNRNIGDLFILAATRHLLNDLGCRVVYASGVRDYYPAAAGRTITPNTIIVGLGGGNFGDLYPKYQTLRERVVGDFPGHRIVVLPQTIDFRDSRVFERSADRLRRHPDLRVAARDAASLDVARRFTSQTALMADIVDVIGPAVVEASDRDGAAVAARRLLSSDGTLMLLRRDHERSDSRGAPRGVDWGDLFPGFVTRLAMAAAVMPVAPASLSSRVHRRWAALATTMLIDAVAIARQASRVVTDRLHGAIVGRIAGRPVTLLDNRYGKLAAYYDAWWRDDPSITLGPRGDG